MPQLIQAGKVYKAVPPLYSIPRKGGEEYFTGQYDFVKYIQKLFIKNNIITDMNNKSISNKDMTVFFMRNQDYVYYLEKLSKTYAVEPKLLELALMNYHNKTSLKALQKTVKSKYRFMEVSKVKDTYVFEGIINESNTLFMNDRLIKDCKPILNILDKNDNFSYRMNGNIVTIYDIMKAFENAQPAHLQRYKGLGEMDADQLAESTLFGSEFVYKDDNGKKRNMIGNRTLIRYTLEDAKEEVAIIREYESDFSQLFKFVGTVNRQDLID